MNDVTCHYTQYKCRPYFGGGTQTRNPKALLTEPLRPLVVVKKNRTGGLLVSSDYSNWLVLIVRRKSILKTPQRERGGGRGRGRGWVRQLRSHVNNNTNLREEKRTVHCSRKGCFHIMNKKNEGIRILFLKKGEPI